MKCDRWYSYTEENIPSIFSKKPRKILKCRPALPWSKLVWTLLFICYFESFVFVFEKIEGIFSSYVWIQIECKIYNLARKFGKESVILIHKEEHLVQNITDNSKHRMFSLRCLSAGITLVSITLKKTVRTSKSFKIISRAEKQLLNERIRAISNTTEVNSWERDACINQLENVLDQKISKGCQAFISRIRKARHGSVWERQVAKFKYCSSKQEAMQKNTTAEVVTRKSDKCTAVTMATQTLHHPAAQHPLPQKQHQHTIHTRHRSNKGQMGEKLVQQTSHQGKVFTIGQGPKLHCCAIVHS